MRIGAVRYLNMLPWFYGDADVILYPTPRELNDAMAAGQLDAACMSAVAGFRQGLHPLRPLYGVAARDLVGSVFLEHLNQEQGNFFGEYRDILGKPALDKSRLRPFRLLTAGASEQSLWLSGVLLRAEGYVVEICKVPREWNFYSREKLLQLVEAECMHSERNIASALLVIGDDALQRRLIYPDDPMRWDIAGWWKNATGMPCLFALWFTQPAIDSDLASEIRSQAQINLSRWDSLSKRLQIQAGESFLSVQQGLSSSASPTFDGAFVGEYLKGLSWNLGSDFEPVVERYQELLVLV